VLTGYRLRHHGCTYVVRRVDHAPNNKLLVEIYPSVEESLAHPIGGRVDIPDGFDVSSSDDMAWLLNQIEEIMRNVLPERSDPTA
jgi:hypothetical protein